MVCHKCGENRMEQQNADLPFRLDAHKILVVKDTPSSICGSCGEILLSDVAMKRIDALIDKIRGQESELEVVRFAA